MAKDTDRKVTRSKEYEKLKETLKARFISSAHIMFGRDIHELPMNEIYKTVAAVAKQVISENWIKTNRAYMDRQEKQVYYFSIEFLMGRLLKANLINLGIDEAFREVLEDLNLNLDDIYEEEPDAGLGNGGLGRLAACFIDSLAAHRLPGHGCSIRYQYGLFEQKIIQGQQVEIPDNWLRDGFAWEYRKPDKSINVKFNGNAYMKEQPDGSLKLVHENAMTVMAVPYDVPIVGYHNKTVNTLRLWNAEVNRDFSDYGMLTHEQMRQKNEYRNFVESITEYLYPDDSSSEGKRRNISWFPQVLNPLSAITSAPVEIFAPSIRKSLSISTIHILPSASPNLCALWLTITTLNGTRLGKLLAPSSPIPIIQSCPKLWKNGLSICLKPSFRVFI